MTMFIEGHVPLPVSAETAVRLVMDAISTGGDIAPCDEAGMDVVVAVGPGALAKRVRARLLEPHRAGNSTVVPVRWEATGPTGKLFPSLDADLAVTPVDAITCVLSLIGSYRPPLGAVGGALDQVAMRRVAQATVDGWLRQIASAVTAGHPVPSSGGLRPAVAAVPS